MNVVVEMVEDLRRGVRSRFYEQGRYSPTLEVGVHYFHRLLANAMNGTGEARVPGSGARPNDAGVR